MTDLTNYCPYPDEVYLADSHVKQNINGHIQIIGMFITDKPNNGKVHVYRRVVSSEYQDNK